MVAFRRAHPVFRRRRFLSGTEASELGWFTPGGQPMTMDHWADPNARSLAIYLDGRDSPDRADDGRLLTDDDFLVLLNSWWEPLDFVIPEPRSDGLWCVDLDTFDPSRAADARQVCAGEITTVSPRSLVVLRSVSSS